MPVGYNMYNRADLNSLVCTITAHPDGLSNKGAIIIFEEVEDGER